MKHYFLPVFTLICGVCFITSCSRKQGDLNLVPDLDLTVNHSMKGWEVYSWPEGNTWKFAFLEGTNRIKTYSEVTLENGALNLVRVTGVDSAKMVLNKFPQGEYVTLISQGWLQRSWQSGYGNLQLPPQDIIIQIKSFSTQKKLTFEVAN